ncbi:MAG: YmdB family metallophosphoesterase [Clostridia bacterium]|nr:YmdB family metallophosphoesterase [Clostridia bacterium]
MRILAIGDIVGLATIEYLRERLWKLRGEHKIDFVVANGENVCDIHGIGADEAGELLSLGIDLITSGNHVWSRKSIGAFLDNTKEMIRPCNYPAGTPGDGYTILNVSGFRVLCINAMGCVYMEPLASPFETVDRILAREKENYDLSLLDFHAEATSEKLAMGYYFDGRIDIIFGTHTHIQTADERILPNGTGYITDLGMTGPSDGILGTEKNCIIERFLTKMPQKFLMAEGAIVGNGAIFEYDTNQSRVTSVKRICF